MPSLPKNTGKNKKKGNNDKLGRGREGGGWGEGASGLHI